MFLLLVGISILAFFKVDAQNENTAAVTVAETTEIVSKLEEYDFNVWCKLQPNGYDCGRGLTSRFYYDTKMENCKTFTYGGCPTSFNNFPTLTACHDACRDPGVRALKLNNMSSIVVCRLQPDFGQCDGYFPMWYFDIKIRACKGFAFSGCGGNYNRFDNPQICTEMCSTIIPL